MNYAQGRRVVSKVAEDFFSYLTHVGPGPRSYRKIYFIETRKSKETVPEAAEKRELNHCT